MKVVLKQYQSFFLLLLMLGLQACASSNPIARAETIEQKAFATYGTFVIFEEQAAQLVAGGNLSRSIQLRIINADEDAKPVADALLAATVEFVAIKAEFEASGTGEVRFTASMNSLNSWVERLLPLVNNLVSSVEGAR